MVDGTTIGTMDPPYRRTTIALQGATVKSSPLHAKRADTVVAVADVAVEVAVAMTEAMAEISFKFPKVN